MQDNTTIGGTSAILVDQINAVGSIKYLFIQNTHASQDLYVRLDGATATTANGIKIAAGKAAEFYLPNITFANDITAIASGASTTVIYAYGV